MPPNPFPLFGQHPIIGTAVTPASADASLTAPANFTAFSWTTPSGATPSTPDGAKIEAITYQAVSAVGVNSSRLHLFLHDGTNYRGVAEHLLIPTTPAPSDTVPQWRATIPYRRLLIPSGWNLRCSVVSANLINIIQMIAWGVNFN